MHDHSAVLEKLRRDMPGGDVLGSLTGLFKVFGDNTRVRILLALSEGELCVCAIGEYLGMNQSAVSHQLKVLKDSRLIKSRREGRTIYYSLADSHVQSIITQGFEHVLEDLDGAEEREDV